MSQDPLFLVDIAIFVGVKALEYTIEQDVIHHVESIIQKLPQKLPVENYVSISKLLFMYYFCYEVLQMPEMCAVETVHLSTLAQLSVEREEPLHLVLIEVRLPCEGFNQLGLLLRDNLAVLGHSAGVTVGILLLPFMLHLASKKSISFEGSILDADGVHCTSRPDGSYVSTRHRGTHRLVAAFQKSFILKAIMIVSVGFPDTNVGSGNPLGRNASG